MYLGWRTEGGVGGGGGWGAGELKEGGGGGGQKRGCDSTRPCLLLEHAYSPMYVLASVVCPPLTLKTVFMRYCAVQLHTYIICIRITNIGTTVCMHAAHAQSHAASSAPKCGQRESVVVIV